MPRGCTTSAGPPGTGGATARRSTRARAELDRYYARAQPLVELGPYRYDADYWIAQDARRERLPLDAAVVQEKMWQFSPPTRFGSRYRAAIVGAPNVQLYTHANVCEVVPNEAVTAVESLVVRHFGGATQQVRARRYVLACCTLQTVRLLLASNRRAPAGLGNRHGQVGRCFMEHLEMPVGRVAMLRPQSMQLYAFDWGATKARAELVLSAAQQRALGVLNASAALEPIADDGREAVSTFEGESPEEVEAFRRETKDGLTDAMRAEYSATPPHDAASVRARPFFTLVTRQEQAPNPDSRVTLGRDCDALGVPRIRLDWRFTALDKRTMRETFLALARELGRAGVARVQLRDWVLADDDTWPPMVSGGWHHLGATRMHEDPRHGVVDAHGRVHDLANLYVAGGGVFPTGGAANPTLTIVALALRLADRLQATAADTR